jgi:hypothetical protein
VVSQKCSANDGRVTCHGLQKGNAEALMRDGNTNVVAKIVEQVKQVVVGD